MFIKCYLLCLVMIAIGVKQSLNGLTMNGEETEAKLNPTSSIFEELIYEELDLRKKNVFLNGCSMEQLNDNFECLSLCNSNPQCYFAYFDANTCYICNELAKNFLIKRVRSSSVKTLYKKMRPSALILNDLDSDDYATSSSSSIKFSTKLKTESVGLTIPKSVVSYKSQKSFLQTTYSTFESTKIFEKTTSESIKSSSFFKSCSISSNFTLTNGLQNYWSFDSSSLKDIIGGADLFGGANYSFTADRFNCLNSSLSLLNGYLQIPSGVYFKGNYTVMAWVYVRSFDSWSRLIDVGNGSPRDNVVFALSFERTGYPCNDFYILNSRIIRITSTKNLILNQWQHLAFVFSNTFAYIYMNGTLIVSQSAPSSYPKNVVRSQNYVGRSSWFSSNPDADSNFDEIKIFSRALNKSEINFEMNNQILSRGN